LRTGYSRLVKGAPVSRTLQNADQFDARHLLQIVEAQAKGLVDEPIESKLPIGEFHCRDQGVASYEEILHRSDLSDEIVDGHFEIERLRR